MSIYFIATKHSAFAELEYEQGSVVLDPFRYIPDQQGVEVRRIGENKPDLISILVPTRGRPQEFRRLVESVRDTATHPARVEIVAYLDEDDDSLYPALDVRYVIGERMVLSDSWNECYRHSLGEILMHCGDDIVFRTPAWDQIVRRAFDESPDKILLVHGDDCSPNTDVLATHGFLHRRWVQTVGYFLPPIFSCDWADVWLTEVADMIGRRVKVPIVTEHMHYTFGKAERDQTHAEREERGIRDRVVELFEQTARNRREDAAKLKEVMA